MNYLFPIVTVCLLAGCSTIQSPLNLSNLSSKTAIYANALFKRQNTLTQKIMLLDENELTAVAIDRIEQAELAMHSACRWLNQYAEYEADKIKTGFFFHQRVLQSLDDCKSSVESMSLILNQTLP